MYRISGPVLSVCLRRLLGVVPLLILIALSGTAFADLTDTPTPWTNFTNIRPIDVGGAPVRDPEGGKTNDLSNGGASFSAESEIASGWTGTNYPCNPTGAGVQCGQQNSMYWDFYDGGTVWDGVPGSASMLDDTMFLRLRINGDPTEPANPNRLNNSHWNFLHDIDGDGYKEFWFDVFGNQDIVRFLYEDNDSQGVTSDAACPAPGTVVTTFVACATAVGTTASGQPCNRSFTRAFSIGDGTGEWYVDIQIPLSRTTDCSGNYIVHPTSSRKFLFSTSDSSTDPIQKDFTPGCNAGTLPQVTCNFTDATPVTLSYFRADPEEGRWVIRWTTTTELGNAGFHVWARTAEGWRRLNEEIVPTRALDSLEPIEYTYTADVVDPLEFAVEDVDVRGRARWHGGLIPSRDNGSRYDPIAIDWAAVGRDHARRQAERAGFAAKGLADASGSRVASRPTTYPQYELHVDHDGVYRVTYEDLAAAGLDLRGVPTAWIALTHRDLAVPVRVEGATARGSTFGPGGFMEFVGSRVDTLYTATNVYRVVVDPALARRYREVSVRPSGNTATEAYFDVTRVENDRSWSFASPNGDPWYDRWILATTTPASASVSLHIDRLLDGEAKLEVGLWGVTNWPDAEPDHHVSVALNGVELGDAVFDGLVDVPLMFTVPAGTLREGANTVTVTVLGDTGYDFDIVALDRVLVSYPRELRARDGSLRFRVWSDNAVVDGFPSSDIVAYRRDDAGQVVRLTGLLVSPGDGGYSVGFRARTTNVEYLLAAPPSLLVPAIVPRPAVGDLTSGPAEYLVITHPDFADGLGPLLDARIAQGLSVKVVVTDDLYSSYTGGIFDPHAIRDYVLWAAENLRTRFVLLVGGDTYDYMNRTGAGSISFVPTMYTRTEALVNFGPSDGLLGDIDGDSLPDVAIGRLPVRRQVELDGLIAKILAYPSFDGAASAVFAADRSETFAPFAGISQQLIAALPAGWSAEQAFIDDLGPQGAHDALVAAINGGPALTHFVGHSDLSLWSFEGLFRNSDAVALTNAGQPTLVVQWGCWNSFFVHPTNLSLAEALLVEGDRGAAAVIGPSGRTNVDGDREMSTRLVGRLLEPGATVGEALTEVKHEVAALNPVLTDVTLGVNLLGDPALVIVR